MSDELRERLRTSEARGERTDVRLVLLEAATIGHRIAQLDREVARVGGGPPGLARGAQEDDDEALNRLNLAWLGLDLQETTMALREMDNLLSLLLGALD